MRTSPIFSALGATALTFGLIASPAPASADSPTDAPQGAPDRADTQSEALQRDLGLSSAEAKKLLANETKARKLERTARKAAGDAFGGAVYDQSSGKLTVSLTDASATEKVEAMGMRTRVVEHGEEQLDEVVDELNGAEDTAPAEVTGWYADLEDDSVVVTALPGETKAAKDLVADAGVDADTVRIEEASETPELYADIIGGLAYYIGNRSRCSVGFTATNSSGQHGFVTAGHCGNVGDRVTLGNGTGVFQYSRFPGDDMAFVRATSNLSPTNLVSMYNGSYREVRGSNEANVGASVCRSGSTTGWHCGTIEAKNQTVRYPQGTVYGMTRTTVCAEPGDSGGSYISGYQAQGVTSGGSGNCRGGPATTFFFPVNDILQQFNLDLYTG
ncbi:S1 family peptidase [Nocardiopsis gilva YIM 90087]|uniref:S1 family peptidase n=1 Tax=Nocardiopsis gilva YIM 90087 TaxID=1235441 RepID=A0A223S6G5_9ACTN|nr:S1 family peptidase [Nocardiopsis gilva]ASU83701.1 S1 family peptidase [Nocardiopsis gilva YIM 90087]